MASTSEREITLTAQGQLYPEVKISVSPKALISPTKTSKRILILGGGVSGLLTAWILLDKGYRVTILSKKWAWTSDFQDSRITSQIAGALWEFPPGGCGLTESVAFSPWPDIRLLSFSIFLLALGKPMTYLSHNTRDFEGSSH